VWRRRIRIFWLFNCLNAMCVFLLTHPESFVINVRYAVPINVIAQVDNEINRLLTRNVWHWKSDTQLSRGWFCDAQEFQVIWNVKGDSWNSEELRFFLVFGIFYNNDFLSGKLCKKKCMNGFLCQKFDMREFLCQKFFTYSRTS
jgi:hypothetical protein